MQKLLKILSGFCGLLIGLSLAAEAAPVIPPKPQLLDNSRQLLVVVTDSWDSYLGHLQPYQRANINQPWQAVGKGWVVVVGKKGLGWGGDFKTYSVEGPNKKEGDNKTPAGVYSLGTAFGFAATPDSSLKLSYLPVTPTAICVDDPQSRYYGQMIDSAKVPAKDWHSAEILIEHNPAYLKGIVVNYNQQGQMPGMGSCIFVHVRGPKNEVGTSGCTAMNIANVTWLWHWLDPKAHPLIVQFPKQQYLNLQKPWGLPPLSVGNGIERAAGKT